MPGRRATLVCAAGLAALSFAGCRENIVRPVGRPSPPPTLNAISPSEAPAGSGGFTLTVSGADFTDSSRVLLDGEPRPTRFVSDVTLMATLSREDVELGRTWLVSVFTPPPGGGMSDTARLVLVAVPAYADTAPRPEIGYLVPAMARRGEPPFRVAVYGSGFTARTVARWNGAPRPTTLIKDSKLFIELTDADIDMAGSGVISVFSPAPGGGVSSPHPFAVVSELPGRPREWNITGVPITGEVSEAAVSGRGDAWVSRPGVDSIGVVDLAAGTLRYSFNVGFRPGAITFDPSGRIAYVVDMLAPRIGVVPAEAGQPVTMIALPRTPTRIAASASALYVATLDTLLLVVDPGTRTVRRAVALPAAATALALAPDGARLYVGTVAARVHELDTAADTLGRSVTVGDMVSDIAVTPDGSRLFVAGHPLEVVVLDAATLAPAATIAASGATAVAVTRDGTQLWAVRPGNGRIAVFNARTDSILGMLYTTGMPHHVMFDAAGAVAVVPNGAGVLQVIR